MALSDRLRHDRETLTHLDKCDNACHMLVIMMVILQFGTMMARHVGRSQAGSAILESRSSLHLADGPQQSECLQLQIPKATG